MAEAIVMLSPSVLKVHPRNEEFFDNIDGADFDRLVESIKEHGVLTPLRVTKDMILISGHQRVRAAIEAGVAKVPVIFDESTDDDDVLMKLIETNFGRMKNDPIKQARWIEEYKNLKGICRGGDRKSKSNNSTLKIEDIAQALGVERSTIFNLQQLLTLDPAIQQLISDGNISPTTGFKLIAKLSPEDQRKLLDKLPDDVKFSAKSIEAKINEIRAEGAANANFVQEENNRLIEKNESLVRENNELRSGNASYGSEHEKIAELEEERRKYYERYMSSKKEIERMRGEVDKALQARAIAESKAKGGDDAVIAMQNRIDELEADVKKVERERDDLDYQLTEKEEVINSLKAEKKDGILRSAITPGFTNEEYNERMLVSFKSKIVQSVTAFETAVNEIMKDINMLSSLEEDTVSALKEVAGKASQSAKILFDAIAKSTASKTNVSDNNGSNDDDDDEIWTEDDMIVTGIGA